MAKNLLNPKNILMWGILIFYSVIIVYFFYSNIREGATTMSVAGKDKTTTGGNLVSGTLGNTGTASSATTGYSVSGNVQPSIATINSIQQQLNSIQTQINAM
jgi:hypothetical protein